MAKRTQKQKPPRPPKQTGYRAKSKKKANPVKRFFCCIGRWFKRHWKILLKIIGILAGLVLCLTPTMFMGDLFGFLPAFAYILALAFDALYLLVLRFCFAFGENADVSDCYRGEQTVFHIRLRNKFILVFPQVKVHYYIGDLFGNVDTEGVATMALGPLETRDFSLDICFAHVGTYKVGLEKAVVSDFFGLFSVTFNNKQAYTLTVKPRLFELNDVEVSSEMANESKRSISSVISEGMDFAGVREYALGDPMKSIHWKLSARSPEGEHFTRLFETYTNPGITIFLDFSAPNYADDVVMDLFDAMVESGLSMDRYSRVKGYDSEVVFLDRAGQRVRCVDLVPSEFGPLVQRMPRMTVGQRYQPVIDVINDESHSAFSNGNFVVCSPNISDALVSTLVEVMHSHRQPILFAVFPRYLEQREKEVAMAPLRLLEANGIPYFVFSDCLDIAKGEVVSYAD